MNCVKKCLRSPTMPAVTVQEVFSSRSSRTTAIITPPFVETQFNQRLIITGVCQSDRFRKIIQIGSEASTTFTSIAVRMPRFPKKKNSDERTLHFRQANVSHQRITCIRVGQLGLNGYSSKDLYLFNSTRTYFKTSITACETSSSLSITRL